MRWVSLIATLRAIGDGWDRVMGPLSYLLVGGARWVGGVPTAKPGVSYEAEGVLQQLQQ